MKNMKKIILFIFILLIAQADAADFNFNKKDFYRSLSSRLSKGRNNYTYLSDEEFANFRAVTSTGIKAGKLYRSSSPVKAWGNRNKIADSAAREAGVRTFINLADEYKNLKSYKDFSETYYSAQKIICLNLNLKFESKKFQAGIARAVNFMANNPAPYLIHCDLGKDRCGIVCAVIESLMGASSDEIVKDYMISFYNYFGIKPGSAEYEFVADNEIRPFLASIFGVKTIENINLPAAATRYLLKIGVESKDIEALKINLGTY